MGYVCIKQKIKRTWYHALSSLKKPKPQGDAKDIPLIHQQAERFHIIKTPKLTPHSHNAGRRGSEPSNWQRLQASHTC